MSSFKIIVFALFVVGCNSSYMPINPNSFNYKASELFFKSDIKAKFDALISYFRKINTLKEVESGWTVYPSLTALGQENSNTETKSFEFNTYLDITPRLKGGRLSVRKFSPTEDPMAVLEINLEFKEIKDAEAFYKKMISDFNTFLITDQKSFSETNSSILIHDTGSESVLKIEFFADEASDLYVTTFRLIMEKS